MWLQLGNTSEQKHVANRRPRRKCLPTPVVCSPTQLITKSEGFCLLKLSFLFQTLIVPLRHVVECCVRDRRRSLLESGHFAQWQKLALEKWMVAQAKMMSSVPKGACTTLLVQLSSGS